MLEQHRGQRDKGRIDAATSGTLKEVIGALGGSATFTLNFTEEHVGTIIWTFKSITFAVVAKDNVIVLQNPNKERTFFPNGSYSMELRQLKKNDSGVYRAEIHGTSLQSPIIQEYVLYVYEYLSRPKVTRDEQDKNGTCITSLTCSLEGGGDNVTYSWHALGQGVSEIHDGAVLPIAWRSGEKDKTLICMARNPISRTSSTPVFAQNLCEDAAKGLSSSRVILYILPLLLVLGFLVLVILLTMGTEKGKGCKDDMERMDSHQKKPNFCPHLEENTEYDTIPYINGTRLEEDAANTLYSTVQIPKSFGQLMIFLKDAIEPAEDKACLEMVGLQAAGLEGDFLFWLWAEPSVSTSGQGASEKETSSTMISGMVGGSVTFPLNISEDAEIGYVAWNYPPKSLAIAMSPEHVAILDKNYQGRLNISNTYSMCISNLTKNDSGSYQAQISQKNSGLTSMEKFILHIYETPDGPMRFSVLSHRYKNVDMPDETVMIEPAWDTSSNSSATFEENEENTSTVDRRNEVHVMDTQGDTVYDLASGRQAEHEVVTSDDIVVKSEVEEDTTYIQVYLNVQMSTSD
ncbi:hypothetical protein STEG23_010196 [Scotinomys teguina]